MKSETCTKIPASVDSMPVLSRPHLRVTGSRYSRCHSENTFPGIREKLDGLELHLIRYSLVSASAGQRARQTDDQSAEWRGLGPPARRAERVTGPKRPREAGEGGSEKVVDEIVVRLAESSGSVVGWWSSEEKERARARKPGVKTARRAREMRAVPAA